MVDYTELRKKFKAKNPQLDEKRRKKQLAIKKIAREYEAKKAEIAGGAPDLKKGPLFYGMVVLVLVVAGSLVVPAIMRGDLTLGKKRIERNELNARKSMDALSVALGRYNFQRTRGATTTSTSRVRKEAIQSSTPRALTAAPAPTTMSSRTSSASTSRSATPPGPTTGRRASCAAWWSRPTRPPSSASRSR